jgi:carboxyl-terminal processing protease
MTRDRCRTARRGAIALALAAAIVNSAAAQQPATGATRPRTIAEDMTMFSQVLNHIRVNHPDSVDTHALMIAAIEGMLSAADPHSYVIVSERLAPEKQKAYREKKLFPVPIAFTFSGGSPVVVSVAPGSKASKLDILPGDELVAVEDKPVPEQSAEALDVALSGNKGSRIALTLERRRADGALIQFRRDVERERPTEATAVPVAFMLDATTGYARITSFDNTHVADDFHGALAALEKQGMRRLVLDLRDNGGGIVDEAGKVAGEFLPKGTVLYTQEGRKSDITDTMRVSRSFWRQEKRYPIVLLTNAGSASATELVAGALQDHDRALIVGQPTFGKSLLMRGFPLADGSIAMMVFGRVHTPCGRVIQRQYHGIARHDYYRMARAQRDTAGRPSCRTDGGRTVYGGGGIFPDVVLPVQELAPTWLARLREDALPFKWVAGHLSASPSAYPSVDVIAARPEVSAATLADFRGFAAAQGVPIPDGAEADRLLHATLALQIAAAKWQDAGYYRIAAVLDPEVRSATEAFRKAEGILPK